MSLSGNILSAIDAAGQLFAGYGAVTLGPVQFRGLGKPKSMPIGGKQAVMIHKLPGGGRVLDAMGPDNADIAWSGFLDGVEASLTARALDRLRQSGQAVVLAWDVFSYQVLVTAFSCDTRHIPMPYKIRCTVISDNTQVTSVAVASLALQVSADLSDGNSFAALSAFAQAVLGNSIALAGSAASTAGAANVGSSAYNGAVNAANAAADAISAASASASLALTPIGASLSALSVAAPIVVDTSGMSSQIVAAASACGDLAQLSAAAGYVNRAAANLQRASA